MSKKTVVFTGLATLIAGIVIGSSGGEEAAVAEPKIQTVTKTETVTEKVKVVPQGCLDALDAAAGIYGEFGAFGDITVGYIDLIQRSAVAGMDMDVAEIEDITAEMRDLTDDTTNVTKNVKPLSRTFLAGSDECRAAAS